MTPRRLALAALCSALLLSAAQAQTQPGSTAGGSGTTGGSTGASGTTANPAQPALLPPSFGTTFLAGGDVNRLTINLPQDRTPVALDAVFTWDAKRTSDWRKNVFACRAQPPADKPIDRRTGFAKSERFEEVGGAKRKLTVFDIDVPPPHCSWPPLQWVDVKLTVHEANGTKSELKLGQLRASVFWFPFAVTIAVVALIYPGFALIAWYIKKRRANQTLSAGREPDQLPDFWTSLDPVQITANSFGRGSLGKLQIFGFTLLVFGLMLYYQLRTGILINLSVDILALLGISAVGATGAKLTQMTKRRISFANWSWLRRQGWLPKANTADYAPRARWHELITDYDGKEIDVYSLQMAIFSLIVAVALLGTNLSGMQEFRIPPELLGLLGISQGVFIVGRAAGTTTYQELDTKLNEVRQQAIAYFNKSDSAGRQTELDKYREKVREAARMFWEVYGEEIRELPPALAPAHLETLRPEDEPQPLAAGG